MKRECFSMEKVRKKTKYGELIYALCLLTSASVQDLGSCPTNSLEASPILGLAVSILKVRLWRMWCSDCGEWGSPSLRQS